MILFMRWLLCGRVGHVSECLTLPKMQVTITKGSVKVKDVKDDVIEATDKQLVMFIMLCSN